ncbi:ribosomal protein S18-domain-containing protein [Endogone sp. FLAS-F59071]|nr:ribosomal protein S18-domain-containing protein [Endogone sp. FLAS-F59071]|eukprot:RUS22269.1 ribosomal protein S18-domain-containing protein [Endogone sp. FLAS-F59071]
MALATVLRRNPPVLVRSFSRCLLSISFVHPTSAYSTSLNLRPVYNTDKTTDKTTTSRILDILEEQIQTTRKDIPIFDSTLGFQKTFQSGTTYRPNDLNDALYEERMRAKRGKVERPTQDPFDALGLDPLKEYKNYTLLSSFISEMGKILPREQTGVTAKNQRKLAKAIKRARAMGTFFAQIFGINLIISLLLIVHTCHLLLGLIPYTRKDTELELQRRLGQSRYRKDFRWSPDDYLIEEFSLDR